MLRYLVLISALLGAVPALAQGKGFALDAPADLIDSGLIGHIVPRFALKTGIRVTLDGAAAQARLGADGVPVIQRGAEVWHLAVEAGSHAEAFLDWLQSDIGRRTIAAFTPEAGAPFLAAEARAEAAETPALSGDAVLGAGISLEKCGRCHVVSEANRMKAIGSTPSFRLMRNFPDWQERFETFFLLKPHPAFTQVAEVTEPFPDNLPPPIAPIEVTLDQIWAITAYVGTLAPADLGAPIQSQ